MEMKKQMRNSFLLLLTAAIWGCAFVAQSVGADYIGPFTFNAVRSVLGGIVLLPVVWFMNRGKEKRQEDRRSLWIGGIACGTILCIGSNLQQFALMSTSAGKAGFITALYIVFIPVIGILIGKRSSVKLWICVLLALTGLYRLCMKGGSAIEQADILLLLGAFTFSLHILVIDYFSPKVDGVKMSCIQFFVCGILSAGGMLAAEQPQLASIQAAWMPLLYAGIMSCGVAYTLQIIGQKGLNPVVASLIMSLESVLSAVFGWLILGQSLSAREISGCVLMFIAIIISQMPDRKISRLSGRKKD